MINVKREVKEIEITESIVCDKCGKKILPDDFPDDFVEWQEFYQIGFIGGYGSVFGDSARIRCDLCQQCLKDLIGDYCYYEIEDGWKKLKE